MPSADAFSADEELENEMENIMAEIEKADYESMLPKNIGSLHYCEICSKGYKINRGLKQHHSLSHKVSKVDELKNRRSNRIVGEMLCKFG